MQTIIKLLFGSLLIVSIYSCSTTELVYIEPKPFQFQKTKELKSRTIRVHKDDIQLYEAYINKFREQLHFHNSQIDDYKNSFKE